MRITIMALAGLGLASAAQANILISEYVEGGGYNKAIELHNAGEVSESLDGSPWRCTATAAPNRAPPWPWTAGSWPPARFW